MAINESEIKPINKAADSSTVFLGFEGIFLVALFIIIGVFFILWVILNAMNLPLFFQFVIPIGLFIVSIIILQIVANKLGKSGINKFMIRNNGRIIFHDRANPYQDL